MIFATVAGNIGRDAEVRRAGNDDVCAFAVASEVKAPGGGKVTTWVDCSLWGQRGIALAKYLVKGTKVTVAGELTQREHNGKRYLGLKVASVALMGGGRRQDDSGRASEQSEAQEDTRQQDDDEIPF